MKSNALACFGALAVLGGAGCYRSETQMVGPATPASVAAAKAGAKTTEERYPLTGEILKVERERKVLIVQHDEIKGYMPAMTMEFLVSDGDLAIAKPGQKIRAEMIPSKTGDIRLEKIWPNDKAVVASVASGASQLRQDTHTRGKAAYREIDENAPDFVLYDHNGRVVQAGQFRGKQIMLNFIFTRCPIANMCPASTAKMITVQKLARDAGVTNLEIISITLDPAYDTPGVLREYADLRGIDTTNFTFLTGPETAIKDLLTQFGVIAQFQGDILQHTLATLLIDAKGKILYRWDNKDWDPKDFVARMKRG